MNHWIASFFLLLFVGCSLLTTEGSQTEDAKLRERAMKLHREAIVIDTHNDITSPMTDEGFDLGARDTSGKTQTDIPRMKEGGLDAEFFAIYVAAKYAKEGGAARRALDMIDGVYLQAKRYPESLEMAFTSDDIRRIKKSGKIAALMGIEGGHAIEDSMSALRDFYRLGVRYMTLTHTNTNNWADSSGDVNNPSVNHHNCLTDFGKEVVREMNRLGMMVDISHVADKTFWDAVEVSRAPVIASHSSSRALTDVPRNMTDEMIVALAKKGGVVDVNFNCAFVSQKSADAEARKEKPPRATLGDVVAHIDHIRKIAGIDAIGIGSDFDGIECTPEGLDDVSKFPNLTRALLEKGYTAEDIRKIYGGNFLRLMRAVEMAAGK